MIATRGKALLWLSNCLEDKMQSAGINDQLSQWREVPGGVGFCKGQCWGLCSSVYSYLTGEWSEIAKFISDINLLRSVIIRL